VGLTRAPVSKVTPAGAGTYLPEISAADVVDLSTAFVLNRNVPPCAKRMDARMSNGDLSGKGTFFNQFLTSLNTNLTKLGEFLKEENNFL